MSRQAVVVIDSRSRRRPCRQKSCICNRTPRLEMRTHVLRRCHRGIDERAPAQTLSLAIVVKTKNIVPIRRHQSRRPPARGLCRGVAFGRSLNERSRLRGGVRVWSNSRQPRLEFVGMTERARQAGIGRERLPRSEVTNPGAQHKEVQTDHRDRKSKPAGARAQPGSPRANFVGHISEGACCRVLWFTERCQ